MIECFTSPDVELFNLSVTVPEQLIILIMRTLSSVLSLSPSLMRSIFISVLCKLLA